MRNPEDLEIIKTLRKNARNSLVTIAGKISMPTSTVYDRVNRFEGDLITKFAALIDFKKLGFEKRVFIIIKTREEDRNEVQAFISSKENVNSVYKINGDCDFLVEAVFKDEKEMHDFVRVLDDRFYTTRKIHSVIDDIKREAFLN